MSRQAGTGGPGSAGSAGLFGGQRAVVTGAGRGIGRAIVLDLLAEGADVLGISRSGTDLERLRSDARQQAGSGVRAEPGVRADPGGRAGRGELSVAALDVRDAAGLEAALADAGADLLVTAAGWNRPGPLTEVALGDLATILEVNVTGTLLACRAFGMAALAAGRRAAVVTLSSQMGVVGYPGRVAYCASKHAVNGLTKALALEWGPHGIRVNAVAPTFIRTPLTEPMLADPAFRADVLARIPLGRIGEVHDVTGAVRFLLSDAAGLITGHILAVDGGWTVQ